MQLIVTLLAILHLPSSTVVYSQTVNTDARLENFAQLKREMSAHYANLEWAIEYRGLDLKQLSERTETRLRQAAVTRKLKKSSNHSSARSGTAI